MLLIALFRKFRKPPDHVVIVIKSRCYRVSLTFSIFVSTSQNFFVTEFSGDCNMTICASSLTPKNYIPLSWIGSRLVINSYPRIIKRDSCFPSIPCRTTKRIYRKSSILAVLTSPIDTLNSKGMVIVYIFSEPFSYHVIMEHFSFG